MELTIAYYKRWLNDYESTSSRNIRLFGGSKEKECLYFGSDAPELLDKLLKKVLIELPKSKRLEEIGRINDSKYCRYHRIISHLIEKCRTFKE